MPTLIPEVWVAASTFQMLAGGMHSIETDFGLAHFILILAGILALALGLVGLISAVQNLFNGAERVAAKYRSRKNKPSPENGQTRAHHRPIQWVDGGAANRPSQQSADEPPAKAEPTPKTPRNEA
jgi:hypothetical protein